MVPKRMMTGPMWPSPWWYSGGQSASAITSSKINRCWMSQPVPPYSRGQLGAPQPFSWRIFCHPRYSRLVTFWPAATTARISGGQALRAKSSSSRRNAA
jgi:hypothetical protein